jgi:hypothetical protein
MAFRPSKRPSTTATRREQRKASGNAALNAGRYQGIPSYNDDPDPVPVPRFSSRGGGMTPFGGLVDAFTGKDYSKEGKKQEFLQYMRDTASRTPPPTNRFRDADRVSMNRYYATNRDIKEGLATAPVLSTNIGSSGLTRGPLGADPFAPTRDARGYIPYREPTPIRNPVSDLTRKGIASIGNVWKKNPLISSGPRNSGSLLRDVVNYLPNVGMNLLGSLHGGTMTAVGGLTDALVPGLNEKTRNNIGEGLMEMLESSVGYGGGYRNILNRNNMNKYRLSSSLDKSKGTAGGGSLSAPNVNKTLTDAEKAGDKILDLGPGVRNRHVQVLTGRPLDDSSYVYQRKRGYDRDNVLGDPDYLYDPSLRALDEEEAIRKAIASRKNLDMTKEGVAARARAILEGVDPKTVYRGTSAFKSGNRRVDNFPGMYANTNSAVARTYGDTEEFLFMNNPKKGGLIVDADGQPYFDISANSRTSYKGGQNQPLGNYMESDWAKNTNEILAKIQQDARDIKYFNPESLVMENIIDPIVLPKYGTKYLQGDNYITLDSSTLKRPTALMLEQFKKLSGFDYRSGGIVSLLK